MHNHRRVLEHHIWDNACRDAVQPFAPFPRPHFRSEQAETHLHETMIEMHKNDILSPPRQVVIKHKRPGVACVGMRQTFCTLFPTTAERWKMKHRALLPLRIRPETWHSGRDKRRLTSQRQGHFDHFLDVLWREAKFSPRVGQLVHQLFDLPCQIPLKPEQPTHRLRLGFGVPCLQPSATPEHGFLNLCSNHRTDFAQVFSNGLHFADCSHQKLQVGFQMADGGFCHHPFPLVIPLGNKVEDMDVCCLLAVPVNAAVALL
jgi:hypothetical protein